MLHLLFSPRLGLLVAPLALVLTGPRACAQDVSPLAEVSVYPNPAHIRATVQVPAVPGIERATVTLVDAQGTVVFEQPVSLVTQEGGAAEVPLLGRKPGLYRVLVRAGEERLSRTLTVE